MTDPTASPVSEPPAWQAPAATPGALAAAWRVFDLSVGQMLWSRRTIFMALVVGLPVLMAAVVRLLVELGAPMFHVNRMPLSGSVVFGLMIWAFFIRFSVPVLALFYGTALIADEVEDRTITYLFTRPIPRGSILVGKYLAYLVATIFVVLPAVVLVWLLIVPVGGSLGESFPDLATDLGLLALGLAVYGAVFALAGAVLKRPLLVGLLFVFGWEVLVLALPGDFKCLTVAYYLQGLVPHALPNDSPLALVQMIFRETPAVGTSLATMAGITAVSLWLAARVVAAREYVLES
jgi:ABC-type transport system involved in multi-copper enzyme maturation permease subunit